MAEMVAVVERGAAVWIAIRPVSVAEYTMFLRAAGRPLPPAMRRVADRSVAATHVSQQDAEAYCQWLTSTGARVYRLPRLNELIALACDPSADAGCRATWPYLQNEGAEYWGVDEAEQLCEWAAESRVDPIAPGQEDRRMGAIFYPPWVRRSQRILHSSCWLLSCEGYSFVGFRVASDQG